MEGPFVKLSFCCFQRAERRSSHAALTVTSPDRAHLPKRHLAATLALLGLVVACGDGDNPTGPTDAGAPLTADEAFALVSVAVLEGEGQDVLEGVPEDAEVDGTFAFGPLAIPCSMGGTVALSGEFGVTGNDPSSGAFGLSTSATFVHSDCVERNRESGIVFTVNGAPSVVMDLEVSLTSELDLDASGAIQGTLRWALGEDRSGSCLIDLNITSDSTGETLTFAGRACGHQISEVIDSLA